MEPFVASHPHSSPFLCNEEKEIALPLCLWIVLMDKLNRSASGPGATKYAAEDYLSAVLEPLHLHHNRLQLCLTDQTTFPQRTQDIISLLVAGKRVEERMSQMKPITLM